MTPEIERWRIYLRRDPTPFLLDDSADPSVRLWYLIDIAHRPEDSLAVAEERERVLYSPAVQEILSSQTDAGGWPPLESLASPRFHSTLWNLALLAELGLPRNSRRARAASEFILESFLDDRGRFRDLDGVEAGYLLHALEYFGLGGDERVQQAAGHLLDHSSAEQVGDEVRSAALWGTAGIALDHALSAARDQTRERLCASLEQRTEYGPITFPPFDPSDPLFILRVLTPDGRTPCVAHLIDFIKSKQDETGRWPLEKSLNGSLAAHVEEESDASAWATLNALRVIVRLVLADGIGRQ